MTDFTTELDRFFITNHFATSITYTPNGGSPVTITVIFDAAHEAMDQMTQEAFTVNTMVTCKSSDVSAEETASSPGTMTISSTVYYVKSVKPDGTGISQVELSKDQ